jgi:hypothetical protein
MLGGYCRGQPWGSPKTIRGILLKTCKRPKRNTSHLSAHTGHGPHCGGPRGPPEWPIKSPLEQVRPRSRVHASLERVLPRSRAHGPLERVPPRSRAHGPLEQVSASLEGSPPPRSRLPHTHARSRTRVRTFNALTRRSGAIVRLGITPRRCYANSLGGTHPWGTVRHGQCQLRGIVPPTPVRLTRCALEGGRTHPRTAFSWIRRVKPWR